MKAKFYDQDGFFCVSNDSGYIACYVRKCAGAYFVQANDIPCFAVMDDFGNLTRVPSK